MHALMVRDWYFISLSSSSAGHVMYDAQNQTVTQLFVQSSQLYVVRNYQYYADPYAGIGGSRGFDGTPYFCSLNLILSLSIEY